MVDGLLKSLIGAALVATGAAVLALLLGVAGMELLHSPHAVVLIVPAAITTVGLFVVQLVAQQRYGSKQFQRWLKQYSPKWMRWLCSGLSLAGALLWLFLLGYRNYEPPPGGVSSLLAGAFCLFVAPASFLTFYSYLKLRPHLRRRCSRGHEMPVDASYCPQCGEHVPASTNRAPEP